MQQEPTADRADETLPWTGRNLLLRGRTARTVLTAVWPFGDGNVSCTGIMVAIHCAENQLVLHRPLVTSCVT